MVAEAAAPGAPWGAGAGVLVSAPEGCLPWPVRREEQARALGIARSRKDRTDASDALVAAAETVGPWEWHGRDKRVVWTTWQTPARPISLTRLPLAGGLARKRPGRDMRGRGLVDVLNPPAELRITRAGVIGSNDEASTGTDEFPFSAPRCGGLARVGMGRPQRDGAMRQRCELRNPPVFTRPVANERVSAGRERRARRLTPLFGCGLWSRLTRAGASPCDGSCRSRRVRRQHSRPGARSGHAAGPECRATRPRAGARPRRAVS